VNVRTMAMPSLPRFNHGSPRFGKSGPPSWRKRGAACGAVRVRDLESARGHGRGGSALAYLAWRRKSGLRFSL